MGNPVDAIENAVADSSSSPASSVVSANQTVSTALGTIGLVTDVPTFSGVSVTGAWVMGTLRCKINGLPMLTTASAGAGVSGAPSPTGPLKLNQSDSGVKAL
ncbi:hypothetical protein [Shimia sp. Alg240-R146]|uniref:hypothetical protein n=1 Tax=Shimia sp. Alg240-R146 TaxID=2993449 RepID=UPI0022DF08C0|nr:hypothetical protein [Shimia sp. Alg240-R146]